MTLVSFSKVIKCKFSESVFLSSYVLEKHFKHHGSGSPKVIKCKFSKSEFLSSYAQGKKFKHLGTHWQVKIRSGSPKVIKCKFSKSEFLSSYAQKKHFKHHGRSKSCQSHKRSSSTNFQVCF